MRKNKFGCPISPNAFVEGVGEEANDCLYSHWTARALFFKERRMNFVETNRLRRNRGYGASNFVSRSVSFVG